ncbi:hypothetical protein [Azohydromonas lata]|uniref:Uncharacterized protein n=1 Tax=Azohydromonas lata TaxID=45677 RepID=A0ABU5ILM2_9BURK|nr:hypothetical protein [Azohydromonas lata]MDZ5459812.1 hypothetical protein [Azohydromonas lata]
MKHLARPHRTLHVLTMFMAGFFSLQPTPLYAPGGSSWMTIAPDAASVVVQVQGFWETVAQYAGR